jgi:uncharacterized protein YoxC
MAKGIEIGIASETRAFKQGIDAGIIAPLDDAQQALEDLARTKGPEKLEQALNDTQTATEQLGRETKDVARDIERRFRDTYRGVKEAADTGMGGARQNVQEFKQEALQNFSEVTSSFDGSMSSIQDLAQGTLGGLASGIAGPIGLAAGGAAVAVGLIGQAIETVGDTAEANEERATEWAASYIEAGQTILSSTQVIAKAQDIYLDPEKFKTAEQAAKDWGVSTSIAVLAMAGNTDALNASQLALTARLAEAKVALAEQEDQVDSNAGAAYDLDDATKRGAASLAALRGEMTAGKEKADGFSAALQFIAENTEGATKKVDKFGDMVYSLPNGQTIYIDAETGQATTDLDVIEKQIYGLPSATLGVDTAQAKRDVDEFLKTAPTLDVVVRLKDTIGRSLR